MPLLDHFHPSLSEESFWESFVTLWISAIVERLNGGLLPAGFRAHASVHLGELAVDVGAFEQSKKANEGDSLTTSSESDWRPTSATLTLPVVYPDELEVRVVSTQAGPTLVAAIELVSPRNKDRPAARRAFAAKCVGYLSQGIGLIIADIVSERRANLHDEIIRVMEQADTLLFPTATALYAVAYRPTRHDDTPLAEFWPVSLKIGETLPTLPLALRGSRSIPIDLEASYTDARRRSQL